MSTPRARRTESPPQQPTLATPFADTSDLMHRFHHGRRPRPRQSSLAFLPERRLPLVEHLGLALTSGLQGVDPAFGLAVVLDAVDVGPRPDFADTAVGFLDVQPLEARVRRCHRGDLAQVGLFHTELLVEGELVGVGGGVFGVAQESCLTVDPSKICRGDVAGIQFGVDPFYQRL